MTCYYYIRGGDVTLMQKDDKINFTLRMNDQLNDRIADEAKRLGITKTALITMVLHKQLENTKV